MEVATTGLVQAVEVWRPAADAEGLELIAGAYGPHHEAGHQRVGRRCGHGQGVVGAAWEQGTPVVTRLGDPESNHSGGGDAYDGLPLSHAVALPAMCGDECPGVLTLLGAEGDEAQGAVELWRPNERSELALAENWYANMERFGLISQHIKFPRRAGLPGKVWDDRFPRVMGSLGDSASFVRVAGAKADGLSTALGIPFMRNPREIEAVLLLLSASRSPLARVMEVWAPDPKTGLLQIVSADYGPYVDLAPTSRRRRLRAGEGLAGRVYEDRAPWLTTDLLGVEFPLGAKLGEYGFAWGAGLPIFVGEDLFAIVTFLQ